MRERCRRQERRGWSGAGTRQQRRNEPRALGNPVEVVRDAVPVMSLVPLDLIARDLAVSRQWRARLAPRQRLVHAGDRRPAKLKRHLPVRALELGVVHVEVRVELVLRVVDVVLAVGQLRPQEEVALARVLLHEEGPAVAVRLCRRCGH